MENEIGNKRKRKTKTTTNEKNVKLMKYNICNGDSYDDMYVDHESNNKCNICEKDCNNYPFT